MKDVTPELLRQLEVLRAGGPASISLFLETSRQAFEKDNKEHLDNWIAVATPQMEQGALHVVIGVMLRSLLGAQEARKMQSEEPTIN